MRFFKHGCKGGWEVLTRNGGGGGGARNGESIGFIMGNEKILKSFHMVR